MIKLTLYNLFKEDKKAIEYVWINPQNIECLETYYDCTDINMVSGRTVTVVESCSKINKKIREWKRKNLMAFHTAHTV